MEYIYTRKLKFAAYGQFVLVFAGTYLLDAFKSTIGTEHLWFGIKYDG